MIDGHLLEISLVTGFSQAQMALKNKGRSRSLWVGKKLAACMERSCFYPLGLMRNNKNRKIRLKKIELLCKQEILLWRKVETRELKSKRHRLTTKLTLNLTKLTIKTGKVQKK
jgi:hypothetical protein